MFIVKFLRDLTEVGLLKWTGTTLIGFDASVAGFVLRTFKAQRPIEKEGFFRKKKISIETRWVIRINDPNGAYEELSSESGSEVYSLWWAAYTSSEQKTSSELQGNLYLGMLKNFGIRP